jgi:hypothetical protein
MARPLPSHATLQNTAAVKPATIEAALAELLFVIVLILRLGRPFAALEPLCPSRVGPAVGANVEFDLPVAAA